MISLGVGVTWVVSKECTQPVAARKGHEMGPLVEPPGGTRPH